MYIKCAVSLHRDFFIVLDLRLTKRLVVDRDGSLPIAFYRGTLSEYTIKEKPFARHLQTAFSIFNFFISTDKPL